MFYRAAFDHQFKIYQKKLKCTIIAPYYSLNFTCQTRFCILVYLLMNIHMFQRIDVPLLIFCYLQVEKTVFVVFFSGEQARIKILKICEAFGANCYPVPEDLTKRRQMTREVCFNCIAFFYMLTIYICLLCLYFVVATR